MAKQKFYYEVLGRGEGQSKAERTLRGPLPGIYKATPNSNGYAYVQIIGDKIQCALRKEEIVVLPVDLSL